MMSANYNCTRIDPKIWDSFTSDQKEFLCSSPFTFSMLFLAMYCGFGSIATDPDFRFLPKSWSIKKQFIRIKICAKLCDVNLPEWFTEEFLEDCIGWESNVAFVSQQKWKSHIFKNLEASV